MKRELCGACWAAEARKEKNEVGEQRKFGEGLVCQRGTAEKSEREKESGKDMRKGRYEEKVEKEEEEFC